MTYNILNGGEERLPQIIEVVKNEEPDFLAIDEANGFEQNSNKILNNVAKQLGFPYCDIALSGEYNYHVAVLSKFPMFDVHILRPLMRACIVSTIKTHFGKLTFASLHLTPYSEDQRLPEINLILQYLKSKENVIMMGDFNSLSKNDRYNEKMVERFNEMQIKKFTTNRKLRFDVVNTILSSMYIDPAVQFKQNNSHTAPTSINEYEAHSHMRLDYIFLSKSLKKYLSSYAVVKNSLTEKASDHYPIMLLLNT